MPLRAVNNRSLTDQVFDQLASEIMSERYPAGGSLPSERALTEVFGVNRQVVREALKRLEQLKLVRIAHGGTTRVLDFRRHARLDLLALMAQHATGGGEMARYHLAVLEMRAAIGVDIVRLCALRADLAVRSDLLRLATEMRAARDSETLFALDVRFWERLLDGAQNIAYRLAVNTLVEGAYVMGEAAKDWFIEEIRGSDYRMPIALAVQAGDPDAAESVARKIMRTTAEVFAVAVGVSPPPVAPPPVVPTHKSPAVAKRKPRS
jgi:GntR family transcriptional repressor for pyruvate dehydrogenase complex